MVNLNKVIGEINGNPGDTAVFETSLAAPRVSLSKKVRYVCAPSFRSVVCLFGQGVRGVRCDTNQQTNTHILFLQNEYSDTYFLVFASAARR